MTGKWKPTKEYAKAYRESHKEEISKYGKTYYTKHYARLQNERSTPEYKAQKKAATIRRNFGITIEQYNVLLSAQNSRCAICGTTDPGKKDWHIDHDHKCCPEKGRSCGKCVRGLLCSTCNVGLGQFKDSVEILEFAIEYLENKR